MSTQPIDAKSFFGLAPVPKKQDMDMEAFMRLLTVQLVNQNPLEPMNDRDFFAQMAQLGQVQGMKQLQDASKVEQAQQLMGKTVTAVRPMTESATGEGQLITGVVKKLAIKNGEYYIGIQEPNGGIAEVRLTALQSIEPQQDLASISGLIGKTVSGMGEAEVNGQSVPLRGNGPVIGVSNDQGRLLVQVQNTDGKLVSIPVSNLEHILA